MSRRESIGVAPSEQASAAPSAPVLDTRGRLIAATLACLRRFGESGTSISAISRESGISRPTIYSHFGSLDRLIHDAVREAAVDLSSSLTRSVRSASTPADAVVEFVVAAHREFLADPVAALVVKTSVMPDFGDGGRISEEMISLARAPMGSMFEEPPLDDLLDEMIETLARFLLSLLTYSSARTDDDSTLRAYLHRSLVPALGL